MSTSHFGARSTVARLRPDLLVALDLDPHVCAARVTAAEEAGERPREFPDEAAKARWVASWGALYAKRIAELADSDEYQNTLVTVSEDALPEEIAASVLERLTITPKDS